MRRGERGFSLTEALIAMAILAISISILGSTLAQSARLNKQQRVQAELQESARTCLTLVTQQLRSAGWNPRQVTGLTPLAPTPSGSTAVEQVRIRADLDGDGDTYGTNEIVDLRHANDRVEWRRPNIWGADWETLAVDIPNATGIPEMFTLSSATGPTTVTVRVTARSKEPDINTGQYLRYTVSSVVTLRSAG